MIDDIKNEIKDLIIEKLDFDRRKREQIDSFESGDYNRFFHALFGKDPIIKYKLTHSIFTSWGMSIYEQSCKIIAEKVGYKCDLQKKIFGELNDDVMLYISQLKGDNNRVPNKRKELQRIKDLSSLGRPNEHPDSTVDVWITKPSGEEVLIDITTVKPNKKSFRALNEKNLTWAGLKYSQNTNANINTYFAFPYNPEGQSIDAVNYTWLNSYYDRNDVLVGNELWKEVSGGKFTIFDMVDIFDDISKLYSI